MTTIKSAGVGSQWDSRIRCQQEGHDIPSRMNGADFGFGISDLKRRPMTGDGSPMYDDLISNKLDSEGVQP
ncbi:hypothetical protein [Algoriphagus sp. AK58]|uniref:hypothetical protein n=1 Tax=Algoriphagus sp. AK58 TaxID=1406877 RepID=UPI0016500BFA|nr:hypothetical protein [Algoriphagus sp. AK58]